MSARWVTTTWIAAWIVALSGAALPACSDGSDSTSGPGTAASSGQSAQGSTGTGGGGCGDVQTDLLHCGACNHPCAPGQTCEAGVCTCGTATAAFAADVQPIFMTSCAVANCHRPDVVNGIPVAPKAGLDLSPATAYAALVNAQSGQCSMAGGRTLVVPGQPADSYIIDKLTETQLCFGKRMPPSPSPPLPPLPPLPAAQIQTISDWICAGALNN